MSHSHNGNPRVYEEDERMQILQSASVHVDDVSDDEPSVDSIESVTSVDTEKESTDGNDKDLEEDGTTMEHFKKQLGHCFLNTNLSHSQANKVLTCLGRLETAVLNILHRTHVEVMLNQLLIDFNIDGASLDKSSKHQIWPIQIRVANINKCKPETVGIYFGTEKGQEPEMFLRQFIDESVRTKVNGGIILSGEKKNSQMKRSIDTVVKSLRPVRRRNVVKPTGFPLHSVGDIQSFEEVDNEEGDEQQQEFQKSGPCNHIRVHETGVALRVNNLNTKDIENIRKSVYRSRRSMLPALPRSMEDIHNVLNSYECRINDNNFY
ncbi:hypothetical protein PV327_001633 [Microctonus hyperodae]|uniref:Uncharacterized protein n=1 Tax=Microctonus hyperodae TaxID=165561 RepID=A0AA39KNB7_MICHY|nr:hypothetical protein PV327_001633 [Microctonus hyperodae]